MCRTVEIIIFCCFVPLDQSIIIMAGSNDDDDDDDVPVNSEDENSESGEDR